MPLTYILQVVRNILGQIQKIKFKVIDLGMGKRVFTEKIISEDILGTNGYHAPEVLTDECYDFTADTFTLGITFCVMVGLTADHVCIFYIHVHVVLARSIDVFFSPTFCRILFCVIDTIYFFYSFTLQNFSNLESYRFF